MKKTIFFIFSVLLSLNALYSQTYIKTNALYWAVGVPNVSGETRLSDKLTLNTDAVFSPWESFAGYRLKIIQVIPELRYFFKNSFNGFYTGIYAGGHLFNMTKWNYKNKYQKGWGWALGLTVGYQYKLSERWVIDSYLGGGWQISRYKGYYKDTNEQYIGLNNSGEWIPYKAGISFAYKICGGKSK